MKNRLALTLAAFGLAAIFAFEAGATMTTAAPVNLSHNQGANVPGIYFDIPALAQNDSAQCVFNVQRLFSVQEDAADVWNSNLMWGANTSTATDSMTVNVQGSFTKDGPWVSLYAGTLQANTYIPSTGYVAKFDQASSTLLPFPWMRVQIRLRGSVAITVAQGKQFFIMFPQTSPTRPWTTAK